jgi:hypothetical protein
MVLGMSTPWGRFDESASDVSHRKIEFKYKFMKNIEGLKLPFNLETFPIIARDILSKN